MCYLNLSNFSQVLLLFVSFLHSVYVSFTDLLFQKLERRRKERKSEDEWSE